MFSWEQVKPILFLLFANIFSRWNPVADKMFSSHFEAGVISKTDYAFKIVSEVSMFLTAGLAAMILPKMSKMKDQESIVRFFHKSMIFLFVTLIPILLREGSIQMQSLTLL